MTALRSPPSANSHVPATMMISPGAAINGTEWDLQRGALIGAGAAKELSSLGFITCLLAVAAGRHFLFPSTPTREREAMVTAYILYFGFGMLQEACTGEVLCTVFVLSYQVSKHKA